MIGAVPEDLWQRVRAFEPIVRAARAEAEALRHLPDSVARAFAEAGIYKLVLPRDMGGMGLDPLAQFDLTEEVATYDGSVGWNFALGSNGGAMAGALRPEVAEEIFASGPACAGSGPPQGRAVAVEGGYRVSGRWAWASGVHQAQWVLAGCFVFDGDAMRRGPTGLPVVIHALFARDEIVLLDTWHTGGMRGTGSTEFTASDVFVPEARTLSMFGAQPYHDDPIFRLPPSVFGFPLTAVPLGIARATVAALGTLATTKPAAPPRPAMAEQPHVAYVVAKAGAMTEAARLGAREAFRRLWAELVENREVALATRAGLRAATVHAVEASVEAVQLCYRAAGGAALFESQPFERALRDVNAAAGHIVFQRAMMEDCGRVQMGLPPTLPMF
ncbi:MAG TPA: acyl-CoA dehydrogenase family protein [Novosphingobium sp.]